VSSTIALFALLSVIGRASPVESPRVDDATRAELSGDVVRALSEDPRVDVVLWDGEPLDLGCTRDPACLGRAADRAGARYIVFGQTGRGGPLHFVILDGYDVRTGAFAGRESVHTGSVDDLRAAVARMTPAVVTRLAIPGDGAQRTRVLSLGFLEAPSRDDDESVLAAVPAVVWGALALVVVGAVAEGVALGLVAWAVERDVAAAEAPLQHDAYVLQRQRNLVFAASLMAGAMGVGLFTFAAMAGTYGLVEEL